ncbi:MAG: ABC transporter ATP-binding protein [Bacteroidales bacterium]|nr:ABC transporter ATP-binding protein [Bacteroidales bacterium]
MKYSGPYWIWILVCVIATIANVAVELYTPQLMEQLIDNTAASATQEVLRISVYLAITIGIGVIIKYTIKFSSGQFSLRAVRDIRRDASEKLIDSRVMDIEQDHSGMTVSKLSYNLAVVHGFLESNLTGFIYLPLILLGTLIYMFLISWKLLLINLGLMVLTFIIVTVQSRPLEKYGNELQVDMGNINSIAQDLIRGLSVIKCFRLYHLVTKRFKVAVDQALDRKILIEKKISRLIPFGTIFESLPLLVSFIIGGWLVIQGDMTPGNLIINIYLLDFMGAAISGIPNLVIAYKYMAGSSEKLFEMINRPSERKDGKLVSREITETPVEFSNVSYSYRDDQIVLDRLNFKIKRSETVALVGFSGSGKSTILKLLSGFYEQSAGKIFLNGESLQDLNLKSARSLMTIVSQDVFLFPASIRENIAYGKSGASMEEIVAAVKAANLEELISKLPQGYDTLVGERGARLSGGEKQRISIARAILKNTPILLLDEPTSSLDRESESLILDALNQLMKNRTTLIVTHRLSGIKNVDRVLVINKGTIVETGTHDALIVGDTLYRRLYNSQLNEQEAV